MNRDLLFITTLKPSSIVWGKTLSAAVLAALIYSVCMPFIVMTYMLRGVDLPSAFLHIVQGYLFALTAILVGILIGGMPVNRFLKAMIGLIGLPAFFLLQMSGVAFPIPIDGSLFNMDAAEAFGAAFKFLWGWALPSVGFFLLSAAFISPPSANRALAPRVYITAAWIVSYVGVVIWAEVSNDHYLVYWWIANLCAVFGWALAFGVSERDELGPRRSASNTAFAPSPRLCVSVLQRICGRVSLGVRWNRHDLFGRVVCGDPFRLDGFRRVIGGAP